MTETSGPIPSESLGKWDQDSSFWRTSQASLWEVMDGHHMGAPWLESWPKQGICQNGELFPLPTQAHHTSGRDGGSWHIPTPTSADVYTGNLESSQQSDDSMHSVSLPDFVNRWPTPRAGKMTDEDEESWLARHAAGKVATPPLALAVRMFPTPTSRDHKDGDAHSCQNVPVNGLLGREVHMLPETPAQGSLSPDWVSWLMGLPVGWTSLEPLPREEYDEWFQAQMDGTWWQEERGLPRVTTGIKNRVNRLKCLGNGIVPASARLAINDMRLR
jgi:hypothetical protein